MNFIEARKLVHEYFRRDEEGNVEGITTALDQVDLGIKPGEFVAVLGHNGSGKSTLAKHLNVLLRASGGTLWVDGKDTLDENYLWDIRQNTGMVFQNPDNQIIASVVEEDVAFGPENIGIPTDEIWERVERSLKSVGMIQYRGHSPNKLSGGQKQRVAIAGVMAMEPKCIVLDEPTAMLDPSGRKEVLDAVEALNREKGVTVILITHYMEEVTGADKVYVMGPWEGSDAGDAKADFFPGGGTEILPAGRAAGDLAGPWAEKGRAGHSGGHPDKAGIIRGFMPPVWGGREKS